MHPKDLLIDDFDYDLPDEKIALHPLPVRDESRLLIFEKGHIREDRYKNLTDYLPESALLIFNETRVIKARILFQKPTGGVIEIFCLEPAGPVHDYAVVLQQNEKTRWKCMIGGAGKWKEKSLTKKITTTGEIITLSATLVEKLPDAYVVELSWTPGHFSFAEILEFSGVMPLPPYIKRKADSEDTTRYQTIYSKNDGSVAAPTAGLHFTKRIFDSFKSKNIDTGFLTLHVGAGTFKPVKSHHMGEHEMHAEWMEISVALLEKLKKHLPKPVFAVGTTSLRALESLYWLGLKVKEAPEIMGGELRIDQWEVYDESIRNINMHPGDAIELLAEFMKKHDLKSLLVSTQIIIAPGYRFRIASGLVTNFHQPKSTLLLLVAAMAGPKWKSIYDYALKNDFRFLSYGDGCLIRIPGPRP